MKPVNILTVDLEDWYHICGVAPWLPAERWPQLESRVDHTTQRILALLAARGVRATFFVLGYIADRHPALIRDIAAAGHEIALHGYGHHRVYRQTPDAFRRDLRRAAESVSRLGGQPLLGYRAPEWSIRDDSLWALDILQAEGFVYDASMAPVAIIGNPRYPRTPHRRPLVHGALWELPPLTAPTPWGNLPIGGGWGLRVFPYALIRRTIRNLNRQGHPAVVFVHPREFDRANPRVALPLEKRFVLEARIARTPRRLERLLDDFAFTTVADYLQGAS